MHDFSELKPGQYPLLQDRLDLIDRFNDVARLFGEVRAGAHADLLQDKPVVDLLAQFRDVRKLLKRPHYRVGFLGTTGTGKSTTLNKVLRAEVVTSGKSLAMTSAITRLARSADGQRTLRLRYLAPDLYKKKRQALCDAADLNHNKPDNELLTELQDRRAKHARGQDESKALPDDLNALEDLLLAYARYGATYVKEPAYSDERQSYDLREQFLNHRRKGDNPRVEITPNLLLDEVEIGFYAEPIPPQAEAFPSQLELIDLPGLGSSSLVDSILTTNFLGELDGALIFLRADQLSDPDVDRIIKQLGRLHEGKLAGRVWIVLTKCDVLTGNLYEGERTIVESLQAFLKKHHFEKDARKVSLVSNPVYEIIDPVLKQAPLQRALDLMKLTRPLDDPIPACFNKVPALYKAFKELLANGGIVALRELLTKELAESVAKELREEAAAKLERLDTKLRYEVKRRHDADNLDKTQKHAASRCHEMIQKLRTRLESRRDLFEPLAQELAKQLREKFQTDNLMTAEDLDNLGIEKLALKFETVHAERLEEHLQEFAERQVLEPLYDAIARDLEGLPAVRVLNFDRGQAAWQDFRDKDLMVNRSWLQALPTFRSSELFREIKDRRNTNPLTGQEYLEIMDEKMTVTAQQTVHVFRVRLKQRLVELEDDYARLIRHRNGTP